MSAITHHLAELGLAGTHGKSLTPANWAFPEGANPAFSLTTKYALAAMSVAQNAPLRILPGELIVGSATLREGAQHRVPLLNVGSVSHTTVGFDRVLDIGYKGLRKEINERLARGGLDAHGTELLEAMLGCLDAADVWNKRNIALLEEMKGKAGESEKEFYQNIIDTLKTCPKTSRTVSAKPCSRCGRCTRSSALWATGRASAASKKCSGPT